MKILIIYQEIKEEQDEPFEPHNEKIILQSVDFYNHFKNRYEFTMEQPNVFHKRPTKTKFFKQMNSAPFQLLNKIGEYLMGKYARMEILSHDDKLQESDNK